MKIIPINLNQKIIIDNKDFEKVSRYHWVLSFNKRRNYFNCPHTFKNSKYLILSRFILNAPKGLQVDHINHNTLDNRRINLRLCNNSINGHNRGIFNRNKLGVSGVYFDKYHKKFRAEIKLNNKKKFLGYFSNIEEAKNIYLKTKNDYIKKCITNYE